MPAELVRTAVDLAAGNPRLARLVADALDQNPSHTTATLIEQPAIRDLRAAIASHQKPIELSDWTWPKAWDFTTYRSEKRQGFVGRQWLFKEVRAWATNPAGEQALLIGADYGVGKSAFLAELLDTGAAGLPVVAHHFCRADMSDTLEPGRFVHSLAGQLADALPAYRALLEADDAKELRETLDQANQKPLPAFNQAVLAPLRRIEAPATRRLLVIDALDEALDYRPEAGGSSRYTIVDLLAKEARNLPGWLRVLATSRRRDEVLKPVREGFFSIEEINAEEAENLADIHAYVQARCEQEPLAPILSRAGLSAGETAEVLQTKSGGKFLYAVRVLNDLASGALTFENRHTLDALPPGMDGFYADTFQRRFSEAGDYDAVKPLLALLCAQLEPMGYGQLAAILEVSIDQIGLWIEPLQDLLRFRATPPSERASESAEEWRISFDHASLEQWLTERSGGRIPRPRAGRFGVNREVAEQQIRTWALAEVEANRAHTSPYLVRHLASHLRDEERAEVIAGQLRQFPWLQARLRLAGIEQLIEDFAIATSNPELVQLERILNELTQVLGSDDGDADDSAFEQLAVQLREQLPEEAELGALRIQAVEWLANRWGRDEEIRARRFAVKDRNTRDLPSRIDTGKISLNALEDMHRTYTGLLDDSMIRYSSDYIGDDFFNKMIAKNIFFGGGLYINDGYLVNHPIARRYLFNEKSLLRVMIDTGFIRIITRASSAQALSQMPLVMAKQGNSSFISLVNSSEWKDFKPFLDRIAQKAFYSNTIRSWPDRDMSFGFTKLMRDRAFAQEEPSNLGIGSVSRDEWLAIRDDFLLRNPEISGPRDKLEKAALKILAQTRSDPRLAMNAVMTVGNQAYHYNFGLALTVEEQNGVAVDTTIGSAFDELLQTRQIERGQLDNIPLLRLPKNMPLERGDLFLDFLDETTKVGQAKLNYVRSLRNVISGVDLDFDSLKSNLNDAIEEYTSTIIDRLAPAFGRFTLEEAFDESFTLAVGSLSDNRVDSVTSTAAPTAGLAIQIQATANEKGKQFLIERFRLRNVSESFDPTDQVIRLGDIKPQIASLAFNGEEAARFIEDIPTAPKS
jgi:hypothetical protein